MLKTTATRLTGVVEWFNDAKGFGFIKRDGAEEAVIFIHFSQIVMDGHKTLYSGDRVAFDLVNGPKGPAAHRITRLHE